MKPAHARSLSISPCLAFCGLSGASLASVRPQGVKTMRCDKGGLPKCWGSLESLLLPGRSEELCTLDGASAPSFELIKCYQVKRWKSILSWRNNSWLPRLRDMQELGWVWGAANSLGCRKDVVRDEGLKEKMAGLSKIFGDSQLIDLFGLF